jgi:hypothetical protein
LIDVLSTPPNIIAGISILADVISSNVPVNKTVGFVSGVYVPTYWLVKVYSSIG